jgi:hypothetical protein
MAKKPSGVIGPLTIKSGPEGAIATRERIDWGTTQIDAETRVLEYFKGFIEGIGGKILDAQHGGTEDLDFLVTMPRGKVYVEMMEAVVTPKGERPFKSANHSFKAIEYAESVFEGVQRKIDKYGFRHEIPLWLLIYTTHDHYSPANVGFQALTRLFLDRKHPFELVAFVSPIDNAKAKVRTLFSADEPIDAPTLEDLKDAMWITFDLDRGTVTSTPPRVIPKAEWTLSQGTKGWW